MLWLVYWWEIIVQHFFFFGTREFKKRRRLLQRKRHFKIKLCSQFSVLRLLCVDHLVQNRPRTLNLAWHECFSCWGKEWKIYGCELAFWSEPQMKISIRHLGDYVKNLHQKVCRTYRKIVFPYSTNHIIDVRRYRGGRRFFNFLMCQSARKAETCKLRWRREKASAGKRMRLTVSFPCLWLVEILARDFQLFTKFWVV